MIMTPEHFCKGPGKDSKGQPLSPNPKVEQRPTQRGRGDKRGSGKGKR